MSVATQHYFCNFGHETVVSNKKTNDEKGNFALAVQSMSIFQSDAILRACCSPKEIISLDLNAILQQILWGW